MSNPLTRTQLDSYRCEDCDDPSHAHEPLVLNARCHPGADSSVTYSEGTLTVRCAFPTCNKMVAEIAVAE